ncbi:MAG: ADP-heptose:LPS heptosyltransferase [Saprospiraceae bacterium]|jgi:ADP-heptose:LPS heptosyltransferase
MPRSKKKILVIRFSSIGDIVLTSPVVRCLKQQLNAEVHFLTKTAYASIVKPNPNIDKVFEIKKQVSEVLSELKAERYDYIIDLHKNIRSLQVKFALGVKASAFDKLNYEKWLMTNFKINKLPAIHIVDRYLKSIAYLGVKNDGKGLDYFIPEEETFDFEKYALNERPYIAFAIGAAHRTKRLPPEKIAEICAGMEVPVVLLGGPGDAETATVIVEQASGSQVVNFCGELNLHQSASLIRQSSLVITHDTGMMHIAAAFHKPILSVWGNTIPEFGMYPYYPEGIDKNRSFQVEGLSCRPCDKIGYEVCPKGHFKCMEEQNVAGIVAAANEQLKSLS